MHGRLAVIAAVLAGGLFPVSASLAASSCVAHGPGVIDVNGDGFADVVVGKPSAGDGGVADAGRVVVLFGGDRGAQEISQSTPAMPGSPERGDRFGHVTAAYDVNGDNCDDLVISAPYEDVGAAADAGTVWVVPGGLEGLDASRAVRLTQDSPGLPGAVESGDRFGFSLDADGWGVIAHLVIGAPGEDGVARDAGAVWSVRGDLLGGDVVVRAVHQDATGVPGSQETGDGFGQSVAVTWDGVFAVGVPREDIGGAADAGLVHLFRHVGQTATHLRAVTQNTSGISGASESGDRFAASLDLVMATWVGESSAYLVVGVPGESLTSADAAHGMVHLLTMVEPRYNPDGEVRERMAVHQDKPGVLGVAEPTDQFGSRVAVSVVPFKDECDECAPLAGVVVGSPYEGTDGEQGDAAAIQTFGPSADPGVGDQWLMPGQHGVPSDASLSAAWVDADFDMVFVRDGDGVRAYGVPWRNLLYGDSRPVQLYRP